MNEYFNLFSGTLIACTIVLAILLTRVTNNSRAKDRFLDLFSLHSFDSSDFKKNFDELKLAIYDECRDHKASRRVLKNIEMTLRRNF